MHEESTLERIEEQIEQLSLGEQLQLLSRLAGKLSDLPLATSVQVDAEQTQRQAKLDAWLAECNEVAELWEGKFDSAADLRQIRDEA
jgi:hypothetical protein